ncbi:aminoglycoside phosphotransferase family protein [Kitasatospora sp. NPDC051853]|uniref:aminoglycoside phosphotransferase family protein n=1 Tax=Kitasatospora sp. NPDC051853 TaxID=3364058 RepID=UPI0037BA28C6
MTTRMHADEFDTGPGLVRKLIDDQFPHWAGLAITPVRSAGTDNAMYRLGEELVVRLPRIPGAVPDVAKEQHWLPLLAPHLPLTVPAPVAHGAPAPDFPHPWSVQHWLPGTSLIDHPVADLAAVARDLGAFVAALRSVPLPGGPAGYRAGPLGTHDEAVRAAIRSPDGPPDPDADPAAVLAVWEQALAAPAWPGPPVWTHGDLLPGNLLARQGRLTAVIDFGCGGVGDPACDLLPAWAVLDAGTRPLFREAAAPDRATWLRARGWALAFALPARDHYRTTNPTLAAIARRTVRELFT